VRNLPTAGLDLFGALHTSLGFGLSSLVFGFPFSAAIYQRPTTNHPPPSTSDPPPLTIGRLPNPRAEVAK
jgi:hypothetical protein